MKSSRYSTMPQIKTWTTDSTDPSPFVYRKQDKVLLRIDGLVEAISKARDSGEVLYLLHELFFALNYWLSHYKATKTMSKKRESAVRALFAYTAEMLATCLGCGVQTLPNKLERTYGRQLTQHGRRVDHAERSACYLRRAEAAKYKIIFRGGCAYMQSWFIKGKKPKLVKADSAVAYDETMNAAKTLKPGFGNCVMSMGRDLFMAPHKVGIEGSGKGFYHSSYLSGLAVQFAGSMLIDDGIVRGIQSNSGHYKTTDQHIVNLLEHLRTVGADLHLITVYNFLGREYETQTERSTGRSTLAWKRAFKSQSQKKEKAAYERDVDRVEATAHDFLACNGNWAAVMERQGLNQQNRREIQNPRELLRRLRSGQITLTDLIQERFDELKAESTGVKQTDKDRWKDAYKEICKDLSLVDRAFVNKWKLPPLPRRAAPAPPRRRPPRPSRAGRAPKASL